MNTEDVVNNQSISDVPKKRPDLYSALLAMLITGFLLLLFYGFPDSPSPWFDEGINLGIARSWAEQGVFSLQTAPGEFVQERALLITTNYPLLAFVALSFKIFGAGLWQARAVMCIFLAVFAALFYFLVKKYYGRKAAIASFALLITFLPFYGNGKSVLGEIPGLTYFLAGLLMLDKRKNWQILLTGLLLGLAVATKPIFLLVAASMLVLEFLWAVKDKRCDYRYWLLMAVGFAVPLFIWIYTLVPNRLTFEYIIKTFHVYSNPYNTKNVVLPNLFRFISESTPFHFVLLFSTFIFAKITQKLRALHRMEVMLFIFVILNLIFFLRTAGWYRYFFPAHILLFILFPAALFEILNKLIRNSFFKTYGGAIIIIILFIVQLYHLSVNFKNSLYYNPQPRQFAEKVKDMISADGDVLAVNCPEVAFFLPSNKVWIYMLNSPQTIMGVDLLKIGRYPSYIISNSWADNFYLKNYLSVRKKYDLVEENRYNIYVLRK